jgi:hypothetical protein
MYFKLFIIFVILLIIYESVICIKRKLNRRYVFNLAKKRSNKIGLPLLVIGDPYNGIASIITGIDYECGDLCIDLTGCMKCKNALQGKLEDLIKQIDINKYVVYISCVLEYLEDLPLIISYLKDMDPNNLFIVTVEWYCIMSRFYPYFLTQEEPAKYIIYKAPPYYEKIIYNKLN